MSHLHFPNQILQPIFPSKVNHSIFASKVEEYIHELVGHLISQKSQSRLIQQSIVAVSDESSSSPVVRTRDVCRSIRSFSGISIPDVTAITRLPTVVSEQSNSGIVFSAISDDVSMEIKTSSIKKKLVSQAPLKPAKKRGRPRKVDKAAISSS
jgi:hypothetical protein